MDLERELRALPIEWPATPRFRPVLARRRRRWPVVTAIALAALATAFAVPQSRGAILRFLDIGADRVEFVDRLPPAQERSLAAGLGVRGSLGEARQLVPELLVPRVHPLPRPRLSGNVVSFVFEHTGKPVLLSELRGDGVFLKKIVAGATHVDGVTVRRRFSGLWLSGGPHLFLFPANLPASPETP